MQNHPHIEQRSELQNSFILKWKKKNRKQCFIFQKSKALRAQTSANTEQVSNLLFHPNTSFPWLQFEVELFLDFANIPLESSLYLH